MISQHWFRWRMSASLDGNREVSLDVKSWWRHQMETFSALLALCVGNSPVSGEFPAQRPVTRSFDVFFDLCLNKRLGKQSWGWWFETPSRLLSTRGSLLFGRRFGFHKISSTIIHKISSTIINITYQYMYIYLASVPSVTYKSLL